jgi:hypothetical protein
MLALQRVAGSQLAVLRNAPSDMRGTAPRPVPLPCRHHPGCCRTSWHSPPSYRDKDGHGHGPSSSRTAGLDDLCHPAPPACRGRSPAAARLRLKSRRWWLHGFAYGNLKCAAVGPPVSGAAHHHTRHAIARGVEPVVASRPCTSARGVASGTSARGVASGRTPRRVASGRRKFKGVSCLPLLAQQSCSRRWTAGRGCCRPARARQGRLSDKSRERKKQASTLASCRSAV